MDAFITPTIGGLLIGGSAVLLLLGLGRIAGISGIVWSAVSGQPDNAWRWLFILGLLLGAFTCEERSADGFVMSSKAFEVTDEKHYRKALILSSPLTQTCTHWLSQRREPDSPSFHNKYMCIPRVLHLLASSEAVKVFIIFQQL